VQWDPYNVPILTDKSGKIEFRDMIAGVTIKRDVDEATGLMGTVIIEHKEDLHPQIVIVGEKKEVLASYSIPAGAHVIVEEGQKVRGRRVTRENSAESGEERKISPAVCREWRNFSKLVVPRMRLRSRKSMALLKWAGPSAESAASF
jgi:DNA-directed RNA polymerase subunit beta'